MEIILRVLQVFLAIGLIGVVLLQQSEGGGLGIGSSGGAGSFMSVRGTANFLTRVTAILAGLFMVTCLTLALLAKPSAAPKSIFDMPATGAAIPAPAPASPAPILPPSSEAPPISGSSEGAVTTPSETLSPPVAPAAAAPTPVMTSAPAASDAQPAAPTKVKPKKGAAHTTGQ
jgi:preprotein translocase subunit SecG